jgi:uncharacterized protein YidB (DUF937 family)
MGLLDSVLGGVMGAAGGGQGGGLNGDMLAQVLGGLLNNQGGGAGGLAGLVQQFTQGGLGQVVQSWVGTGANLPVSADQLQAVLGNDTLAKLAQQVGLNPGDLAGHLSLVLPQVVDHLTPGGQLPADGGADLSGMLGGLLGGLMQQR